MLFDERVLSRRLLLAGRQQFGEQILLQVLPLLRGQVSLLEIEIHERIDRLDRRGPPLSKVDLDLCPR